MNGDVRRPTTAHVSSRFGLASAPPEKLSAQDLTVRVRALSLFDIIPVATCASALSPIARRSMKICVVVFSSKWQESPMRQSPAPALPQPIRVLCTPHTKTGGFPSQIDLLPIHGAMWHRTPCVLSRGTAPRGPATGLETILFACLRGVNDDHVDHNNTVPGHSQATTPATSPGFSF